MRKITLLDGKERPIYFDFNVVAEVQDRYGDITKLPEKVTRLKEVKWLVATAVNEGTAKKNHDLNTNDPEISEFEVGMLLPLEKTKLQTIVNEVVAAFYDCVGGRKNAEAVTSMDGTTLPSSTQEGGRKTE